MILFIVLLGVGALMLLVKKSKQELKTFILCGVAGATVEMIAIAFGAWTYANPNLINVPIWLPVLWGIAAVFMSRVHISMK